MRDTDDPLAMLNASDALLSARLRAGHERGSSRIGPATNAGAPPAGVIQRKLNIRGQTLPQLETKYPPKVKPLQRERFTTDLKRLFNDKETRDYGGAESEDAELAWIQQQITEEKSKQQANKKTKKKKPSPQPVATREEPKELPLVVPKPYVQPAQQLENEKQRRREQAIADHEAAKSHGHSVQTLAGRIGNWLENPEHDGIQFMDHKLRSEKDFSDLIKKLKSDHPDEPLGFFGLSPGSGKYSQHLQFKVFVGGGAWDQKKKTFHVQRGSISNTLAFHQAVKEAALSGEGGNLYANEHTMIDQQYDDFLRDEAADAAAASVH